MGLLSGLIETALDVVTLPVSVVKDVVHGDGSTERKVNKIVEDVADTFDGDII